MICRNGANTLSAPLLIFDPDIKPLNRDSWITSPTNRTFYHDIRLSSIPSTTGPILQPGGLPVPLSYRNTTLSC